MTRGVFPRQIGWSDDVMRDVRGALGTPGALWDSGSFTLEQMQKVMPADLPPAFSEAFRNGRRAISIGEKDYAASAMAGRDADIVIFPTKAKDADGTQWKGWLKPAGANVPDYIATPVGGRFWLDGRPQHGTESNRYSLGGGKFWPGDDPQHPGGDVWVVDAALAVMEHEDWGAMFLTLGGVDKVGHMMGADHDLEKPNDSPVKFAEALRIADREVGRLIDALAAKKLDRETVVILTADHGGMYVSNLRARNRPGKAGYDWNWGRFQNGEMLDPQPEIAKVIDTGKVAATSTDTMLRFWTNEATDVARKQVASVVAELPGVLDVFIRVDDAAGSRYARFDDARLSGRVGSLPDDERFWYQGKFQELLDTAASPSAADVVGLLDHKTGYAVPGDHGGQQKKAQSIPILFAGPGVKPGRHKGKARLVDIAPTAWKLASHPSPKPFDGAPLCAALVSGC